MTTSIKDDPAKANPVRANPIKDSVTPRPTEGLMARIAGLEARLLALLALAAMPWRRIGRVAKDLLAAERTLWWTERHNLRAAVKREMLSDPAWRDAVASRLGRRRGRQGVPNRAKPREGKAAARRSPRSEIGFVSPRRHVRPCTRRVRSRPARRALSRAGWLRGIVVWPSEIEGEIQDERRRPVRRATRRASAPARRPRGAATVFKSPQASEPPRQAVGCGPLMRRDE